jgi:hypothetical protein
VLGEPTHLQVPVRSNVTGRWLQFTGHEFNKCRLTCIR